MKLDTNVFKKIGVSFEPQARLSDYTTFRLGGPCPYLVSCQTTSQLERVVDYFVKNRIKFILIGGGSNLVVSDKGVDCAVIRYVSKEPLMERDGNDITATGSTNLDDLALFAIQEGLEGLNTTHGIPGTVGGAVVGNAGAFGKQVGDVTKSVVLLTLKGRKKEVGAEALKFTYRNSLLKETNDIVVSVRFSLWPGDKDRLKQERQEILNSRREKHPDLTTHPCAGSFFRNIEPTSKAAKRQAAGFFLEQAGGKSLKHGGAVIFEKHANIIVKGEACQAQDVYELSKKMSRIVKDKFSLNLVREVRFVGKFDGMPSGIKDTMW